MYFGVSVYVRVCFISSGLNFLTRGSGFFALDRPGSVKSVPAGPLCGTLIFEGNSPLKALPDTEDRESHEPLCMEKTTHVHKQLISYPPPKINSLHVSLDPVKIKNSSIGLVSYPVTTPRHSVTCSGLNNLSIKNTESCEM